MTHQEYFDKLTDSIDTLSDILDTEHYGMCLVDKDGYIIKWYYEKFFNIKASAAVGRHVTEVIENSASRCGTDRCQGADAASGDQWLHGHHQSNPSDSQS